MSLNLRFEQDNETFSWDHALLFTHLSRLAYSDEESFRSYLKEFQEKVIYHGVECSG